MSVTNKNMNEYESDLYIDESALDVEWLTMPELTLKYSGMCADAKKRLDVAKTNLDYLKAKIDKAIRRSPSTYGIDKITESAILYTILGTKAYREAQKEVDSAKYENDLARVMLETVLVKKEALENLVKLYGLNYFSGPKVPHDIVSFRQTLAKKRDGGVQGKIAMKKKKKHKEE